MSDQPGVRRIEAYAQPSLLLDLEIMQVDRHSSGLDVHTGTTMNVNVALSANNATLIGKTTGLAVELWSGDDPDDIEVVSTRVAKALHVRTTSDAYKAQESLSTARRVRNACVGGAYAVSAAAVLAPIKFGVIDKAMQGKDDFVGVAVCWSIPSAVVLWLANGVRETLGNRVVRKELDVERAITAREAASILSLGLRANKGEASSVQIKSDSSLQPEPVTT